MYLNIKSFQLQSVLLYFGKVHKLTDYVIALVLKWKLREYTWHNAQRHASQLNNASSGVFMLITQFATSSLCKKLISSFYFKSNTYMFRDINPIPASRKFPSRICHKSENILHHPTKLQLATALEPHLYDLLTFASVL